MNMADPAEMLRIAALLETLVLVRKVPIRKTEKALGLSNGYLARVFSGKIELKYRHILDILDVVGMEPRDFFELAYPEGSRSPDSSDFVHKLRPLPEPEDSTEPDTQDFEARVIELLVKLDVPIKKPPAGRKASRKRPTGSP